MIPEHRLIGAYEEMLEISKRKFQRELAKFLEPLHELFGIDVFFYSNLKEGGRSLHLCSDPDLLADYLHSGFITQCPLHSRYFYTMTPAVSVLDTRPDGRMELEPIYQYYNRHKLTSGITLTLHNNHYREMFYFGMNKVPKQGVAYWYGILPSLYDFVRYFTRQAKTILKESEPSSIILPDIIGEKFFELDHQDIYYVHEIGSGNMLRKKLLEFTFYDKGLTKREATILPGCLAGKTSKEIALELSISPRTVENNIQQIKEKFNCRSQRELIALLSLQDNLIID